MLNLFRENLKKLAWILWVVIAVFVLLVFADFRNLRGQRSSPNAMAARVGAHEISFREFQSQYRNLEDRLRAAYGDAYNAELAKQMGVPMQAMSSLIAQKIALDEAERMGLEPTDEELRRAILQVPALQDEQGNFIGYEEYKRVLQMNRIPVDQFERNMREQVLLEKFNEVLSQTVWVSDEEVEQQAREQAEKATIEYVSLTAADLANESVTVSDADLQAYFDEHKEAYRQPERRRVGYLSINVNTVRGEIEIPEQDLHAYYDSHPDEFTRQEQVRAQHILLFVNAERTADQAKEQLEALRRRIEAGEDFGKLAAEYSEDEATKQKGGDLGFFGRGTMTQQFEQAAFEGGEGELIGPVENQLGPRTGYHLIRVNAKQPGGKQSFEEVENRIRVRLLNERARDQAEQKAKDLYAKIKGEKADTEEALRALGEREGVPVEMTEPFGKDDSVPRIGRGTPFTQTAFEAAVGTISEPVRVGAGWALLDVLQVLEPRLPELSEVQDQVRQAVTDERRKTLASERLQAAKQRIDAGTSFEDAVKGLGLETRTSNSFGARGSITGLGVAPAVTQAALALEVGGVGGPIATDQGTVLFRVSAREHFDPATFGSEKELLREQLASRRFNALLASVIEKRRGELDISYSRQFLQSFEIASGPGTPDTK